MFDISYEEFLSLPNEIQDKFLIMFHYVLDNFEYSETSFGPVYFDSSSNQYMDIRQYETIKKIVEFFNVKN